MKTIVLLIMFILFLFLLFTCSEKQNKDDLIKVKLESTFRSAINNNVPLAFRLDTITDFEWDNFVVLPPYSNLYEIGNKININLSELKSTGIEFTDNKSILLFIKSKKVYKYVEFSRDIGDFSSLDNYKLYSPENALFKLSPSIQIDHYIVEEIK